ncbi:MAG: T9SS type A sorting domain-containing protein [Ignavibacterium sp.]|nr:T9SS type A sorting domain-containing protein [Ignavibacterium sp.]
MAEYYITAVYFEEESYAETNPSNTIRYQRVQGSGLDKKSTGEMVQNLEYKLEQNYPNPFNPSTVIKYSVKESGLVELEILNILGERVKTLVNDIQPEGSYEIEFNARVLASGIYLYRLKVNDYLAVKKMILMK